jgi:hypothetical protein
LLWGIHYKSNTTRATSGTDTAYPAVEHSTDFESPIFVGFMLHNLKLSVYCFVDNLSKFTKEVYLTFSEWGHFLARYPLLFLAGFSVLWLGNQNRQHDGLRLCCLMSLSTIYQLYHDDQYPEKTTDLRKSLANFIT